MHISDFMHSLVYAWIWVQICDWGYSETYGLLFAFGAKDSIFLYQVQSVLVAFCIHCRSQCSLGSTECITVLRSRFEKRLHSPMTVATNRPPMRPRATAVRGFLPISSEERKISA